MLFKAESTPPSPPGQVQKSLQGDSKFPATEYNDGEVFIS